MEAKYRERQEELKDSLKNKQNKSSIDENKDFKMFRSKNYFELPIPKYLQLVLSDSINFSFQRPLEKRVTLETNKQFQIVITIQPKRSTLSQNSVFQVSTDVLDKLRKLNEETMRHAMPTFIGWENYKLLRTTISTGTNGLGYNYILTNYEFDVNAEKFYSKLYMYPLENKIIRVQYYFPPESAEDVDISATNTNLFE
ncbi:MAG: hypothetical protein L6407_05210 [Candidatus Delongbacteria bacterium]|nr:hypothetical protein [Candidatus Delongbacteria bacterium]